MLLARYIADEDGATAVEFAVIAATVVAAVVPVLTSLGHALAVPFMSIEHGLSKEPGSAAVMVTVLPERTRLF